MQIYNFIDICFNNKQNITDEIRYQIPNEYSEKQWINAAMFLISNLSKQHTMPSKDIDSLIGIGVIHRKDIPLTNKQKLFVTNTLIDYWDQLDVETFIQLNL